MSSSIPKLLKLFTSFKSLIKSTMSYLKVTLPGVFPIDNSDRKPIIKVIGGDTWRISTRLYDPLNPAEPATPDNTIVRIKLAETQFDTPIWTGEWYEGITPDKNVPGLCHIVIPKKITKALRRGSYMFSVNVSDLLRSHSITEATGSILVEYTTTSEHHSIPYKDGTSGGGSGDSSSGGSGSSCQNKPVIHTCYQGPIIKVEPETGNLAVYTL